MLAKPGPQPPSDRRAAGDKQRGGVSLPLSTVRSCCCYFSPRILNSTRRFKARPASVSFVAIGMPSP